MSTKKPSRGQEIYSRPKSKGGTTHAGEAHCAQLEAGGTLPQFLPQNGNLAASGKKQEKQAKDAKRNRELMLVKAEWEWELMREVATRTKVAAGMWGVPHWMTDERGRFFPSELGAWKDLPEGAREYFAQLAHEANRPLHTSTTGDAPAVDVFSPFSLLATRIETVFQAGDWGKSVEKPMDAITAFLRASTAASNARVIVAVVDEGTNVAEAQAVFGKALTKSREDEKLMPQDQVNDLKKYRGLLRALKFYRLKQDVERRGGTVGPKNNLSGELVKATDLTGKDNLKTFRDICTLAKREIEEREEMMAKDWV